ncbi:MAG: hypothetical protein ACREHD_24960 [Pirellulales bacterium]
MLVDTQLECAAAKRYDFGAAILNNNPRHDAISGTFAGCPWRSFADKMSRAVRVVSAPYF